MTESPLLAVTRLAGAADRTELLVVGPSLGTSVEALWSACAARLADRFEVVGWDLPGHGRSRPTSEPFSVADLADTVRREAAKHAAGRGVHYAGVSLGGAVGFVLALDPGPFGTVTAIASAPRIGEPAAWQERATLVRRAGTPVLVEGSVARWFAPGSVDRHPEVASRLLTALVDADDESYALACEALAGFDLDDRVGRAAVPVAVIAGQHDPVVTVERAAAVTCALPSAGLHVVPDAAHLPPAEAPDAVAALLRALPSAAPAPSPEEVAR